MCGNKTFVSDEVLVNVVPPASGWMNNDTWHTSSWTDDITKVGIYPVTITARLEDYPGIPPVTASFTLTVIDECETAIIDPLGQTMVPPTHTVMISTEPTNTTFLPFTDNVAQKYGDTKVCRDKNCYILESYPFTTLFPPESGLLFIDPWTISVDTFDLADVGVYTLTIECVLVNYPDVAPASTNTTLTILHPCVTTTWIDPDLHDLNFYMGDLGSLKPSTQTFQMVEDKFALSLENSTFCGERIFYISSYDWLSLKVPLDPWGPGALFEISVYTDDTSKVGTYEVELVTRLADYPTVLPSRVLFTVNIVLANNALPYFEPKLPSQITLEITPNPE